VAPIKAWLINNVSDADYQKQSQEDLDSLKKDEPHVEQHFDMNGVRIPDKLKDYHRDGDANRFCKDNADRYFNEHRKEVLDDTLSLDVRSMK